MDKNSASALKIFFLFIGVLMGTSFLWFCVAGPIGLLWFLFGIEEPWDVMGFYVSFLGISFITLMTMHWNDLKPRDD